MLRYQTPGKSAIPFTLKAPADDTLNFFFNFFSEKIILDISCESSAGQSIHIKHHALFSSNNKIKVSSVAILLGSLKILHMDSYNRLHNGQ